MARGRYPRRMQGAVPAREIIDRYLLRWHNGELYRNPERFPRVDSSGLFGIQAPFELEAGCGIGEFLCTQAAGNPEVYYVGVDVALKPLFRAVQEASGLGLTNILFIKADFKLLYPLLTPESIRTLYLHFPNPNKRAAYRKRRIFDHVLLKNMQAALEPGGSIIVMTDDRSLYHDILELVESDTGFERLSSEDSYRPSEVRPRSYHQRLWEGRGRQTLYLKLRKKG